MALHHTTPSEDALANLIDLIESVRMRRQADVLNHSDLKTFSQRELTDVACPSYKNYLLGRSKRLPTRESVLEIADYLECTTAETDDLLLCAGYTPTAYVLREDEYRAAVARAQLMVAVMPLPTAAIGRNGEILFVNMGVHLKIDSPPLETWPTPSRNIVSYFFDPSVGVSQRYQTTPAHWQETAYKAAGLLYMTNHTRLREHAFKRLVRDASVLPGFEESWHATISAPPSIFASDGAMTLHTPLVDSAIRERNTIIPLTAGLEVSLIVGVPVNEAAQAAYRAIGCDITETRWEQLLMDLTPTV
ncbi:MAG: hypothetical protein AAF125_11740 [Chloroflexota bacterium]